MTLPATPITLEIGGDLLGLAARFRVQAVELDREVARLNLGAAGLDAGLIQADLRRFPIRADGVFLDAYLSGATLVPTPFARAYRVQACLPFNLKRLRQFLVQERLFPAEIKKRRFPIEPQELRQLLDLPNEGQGVTLILTRLADRPFVLILVSAVK